MRRVTVIIIYIACVLTLNAQINGTINESFNNLYPSGEVISKYHNSWTRVHYKKRVEVFKYEPLTHNNIVFIGNSITEKGGDWSEKTGIKNISNRGISGDVTDGVLKRMDEIIHFQPKAVFILIGINDLFSLHHQKSERTNIEYFKIVPSTDYVAKNILKITKIIYQKSPGSKIYVRTILPTRHEYLKDDILKVNSQLKKNEEKGYYTLIDLHSAFTDKEGMLNKAFTNDGVHLNEHGYKKWVLYEKTILAKIQ